MCIIRPCLICSTHPYMLFILLHFETLRAFSARCLMPPVRACLTPCRGVQSQQGVLSIDAKAIVSREHNSLSRLPSRHVCAWRHRQNVLRAGQKRLTDPTVRGRLFAPWRLNRLYRHAPENRIVDRGASHGYLLTP